MHDGPCVAWYRSKEFLHDCAHLVSVITARNMVEKRFARLVHSPFGTGVVRSRHEHELMHRHVVDGGRCRQGVNAVEK